MTNSKINSYLLPNVSKVPSKGKSASETAVKKAELDEFHELLGQKLERSAEQEHGVSLSKHAQKRIQERNLDMDTGEFFKLKNAIDKLRTKGGQESLVITGKAAYIIDVNSGKVVTAMDKNDMAENVFTKIDSTLVLN